MSNRRAPTDAWRFAAERCTVLVRGRSMRPGLLPGDRVTVRAGPCSVGDVVVVRRPSGRPMIHRVRAVLACADRVRLITRGDAVARDDGPVDLDDVVGVVTSVERAGPLRRVRVLAIDLALALVRKLVRAARRGRDAVSP